MCVRVRVSVSYRSNIPLLREMRSRSVRSSPCGFQHHETAQLFGGTSARMFSPILKVEALCSSEKHLI
jgi:hypothetical protein